MGAFEVDETRRELSRDGRRVSVEPQPLNLLLLLLRHAGELVTKDELIESIWNGRMASDAVMARCVAKLRAALDDSAQQLIRTVHGYGYRLIAEVSLLNNGNRLAPPVHPVLKPGTALPHRPHWRLERALGEASNTTWLACHEKTRERRVFKFADDAAALSRLKREVTIQRLLMTAPDVAAGVVPVLDWNFSEAPWYLELPYCAGGSLGEWLQARGGVEQLDLAERIEIVVRCADRLAAVHAIGVLHKDFKPGNILVRDADSQTPDLLIADLGSSRVLDPQRLQQLQITQLGMTREFGNEDYSGTLLYLAPEVAAGQPATQLSDVYALGVILYQLVVGDLRRPLAPGWERDIDDELLCEDIAAAADVNPRHRLPSALALAQRLRELDARHDELRARCQAAFAAEQQRRELERARVARRWQWALVAVLVLGLLSSGLLSLQTARQRSAAQTETAIANALNRFVNDDLLGAADPYAAGGGRKVTVGTILDLAAQRVNTLARQPEVHARSVSTIARAYARLGLEPDAQQLLKKAIALDLPRLGLNSSAVRDLLRQQGWLAIDLADYDVARATFEQLLSSADQLPAAQQTPAYLKARYGLARVRFDLGYFVESQHLYEALLDDSHAAGVKDRWLLTDIEWDLAESLMETDEWERARKLLADVHRFYLAELGPNNARLLWLMASEGYRLQMLERWDEAETVYQNMLASAQHHFGEHHPITVAAMHFIGMLRVRQGRAEEAVPYLKTALKQRRTYYGEQHYLTRTSMMRLGEAYTQTGRTDLALPLLNKAERLSRAALGDDHPHTLLIERMRAEALARAGRSNEAEVLFRHVLKLGPRRMRPSNNRLAWTHYGYGRLLLKLDRQREALQQLDQARAAFLKSFGPGFSMLQVIDTLIETGQADSRLS